MKTKADEQKPRWQFDPVKLVARIIPVLGPIPTMISVFDAAYYRLKWNVFAAGSAALLIELLGFFSVNLAERMWSHNKSLRLDEKSQKLSAPTWKAVLVAVAYLVIVEAMIALVDINAGATIWLPVTLPLAGILGSIAYALWVEQDGREAKVQEWRENKKERKQGHVAGASNEQSQPASDKLRASKGDKGSKLQVQVAGASTDKLQVVARKGDKQPSKQPVQDEALLAHWSANPQASDGMVAKHFGTSRQAIQQRREKLIRNGEIKMGERGVEIVGIRVDVEA